MLIIYYIILPDASMLAVYRYLHLVWSLLFVGPLLHAGSLVILFGFLAFLSTTRLLLGNCCFFFSQSNNRSWGPGLVDNEWILLLFSLVAVVVVFVLCPLFFISILLSADPWVSAPLLLCHHHLCFAANGTFFPVVVIDGCGYRTHAATVLATIIPFIIVVCPCLRPFW